MVLADDNFASIAAAVEEGRTVYDNLKKVDRLVSCRPTAARRWRSSPRSCSALTLPITPVQILWVNMVTAVTLGLALAFEPAEPDVMRAAAAPARRAAAVALPALARRASSRCCCSPATFGLFLWRQTRGLQLETARTIAVNTLVALEIVYLFNTPPSDRLGAHRRGLASAAAPCCSRSPRSCCFQLLFTYAGRCRRCSPRPRWRPLALGRILLVAASVFVLVELEKWLLRRRSRPAAAAAPAAYR